MENDKQNYEGGYKEIQSIMKKDLHEVTINN